MVSLERFLLPVVRSVHRQRLVIRLEMKRQRSRWGHGSSVERSPVTGPPRYVLGPPLGPGGCERDTGAWGTLSSCGHTATLLQGPSSTWNSWILGLLRTIFTAREWPRSAASERGGSPARLLGPWLVLKSGSQPSSSNTGEALRPAAQGIWRGLMGSLGRDRPPGRGASRSVRGSEPGNGA